MAMKFESEGPGNGGVPFYLNDEPNVVVPGGFAGYMLFNNQDANNVVINYQNGDVTVANWASYVIINGNDGGNHISSGGNANTIYAGGGDDTVYCDDIGIESYVDLGSGNDIGRNKSNYGTLLGGPGDDELQYAGNYGTVDGGEGKDKIYVSGSNATVIGNKDDDTISLEPTHHNAYIHYTRGDGDDTVVGFSSGDTLFIDNSGYTTSIVGDDLIVKVSSGKITLKDVVGKSVYIEDNARKVTVISDLPNTITLTEGDDTYTNYKNDKIIYALAGNDSLEIMQNVSLLPEKQEMILFTPVKTVQAVH